MQAFKHITCFVLCALVLLAACTERSTAYDLDPIEVGVNDEAKTRVKRQRQFVQTLYNHIYQKPISPDDAAAIDQLLRSIGDSQVAIELVVAKMVSDSTAVLPTEAALDADPGLVVADLYKRLFVRSATSAELSWWTNYLETHPEVDVGQLVYAFATSTEYRYY